MRRAQLVAILLCASASMLVAGGIRITVPIKVGDIQGCPMPTTDGKLSLERAMAQRRSCRAFAERGLNLGEVSQLAWAAQGITNKEHGWRTAPSAAHAYFLDLYLIWGDAVLHYLPARHAFETLAVGGVRARLAKAIPARGKPPWVSTAPALFIITADYSRGKPAWGERGKRFATIEVGTAVQNLHLQAITLGLSGCCVGGYDDAKIQEVIGAPKSQLPLILFPVGAPKKK